VDAHDDEDAASDQAEGGGLEDVLGQAADGAGRGAEGDEDGAEAEDEGEGVGEGLGA